MRTSLVLLLLAACFIAPAYTSTHTESSMLQAVDESKGALTLSFQFQRGGIASSQYAVWIENEKGELVRTVYATSFTAKGGFRFRKASIPTWVMKAQPEKMTDAQVDAITGATPRNGTVTYVWDGTDENGNPVPSGNYRFYVEGTLYQDSRILFSGTVQWGGKSQSSIPVDTQRINASSTNENMITGLKASYRK